MPLYNPYDDTPAVRLAALEGVVSHLRAENAALAAENKFLRAIDQERQHALDLLDRDRWGIHEDLKKLRSEYSSFRCKYRILMNKKGVSGDEVESEPEPVAVKERRYPRRGGKHERTS